MVCSAHVFELILQLNELLFTDLFGVIRGGVLSLQLVDDVRLNVFDVQSLIVTCRLHVRRELTQCAHGTPAMYTEASQCFADLHSYSPENVVVIISNTAEKVQQKWYGYKDYNQKIRLRSCHERLTACMQTFILTDYCVQNH